MRLRALSCLAAAAIACAIAQDPPDPPPQFDKTELMIPVRDGVKLHTVLFTPKNATGPLPVIFERTPYGARSTERALRNAHGHLAADGYIFAYQDIRGRFKSEGDF